VENRRIKYEKIEDSKYGNFMQLYQNQDSLKNIAAYHSTDNDG